MYRWNIKRNSCLTIRNGNFQGNDSDSVCYSPTFQTFNNENNKTIKFKGQELGSGCFGRVVKGEAVGIKDSEETVTTVAVKMIKATVKSNDALDALIRELKIMIYLGSHLNVVNLMGACTKTLVKGKITNI
jgi:hypothetical protein